MPGIRAGSARRSPASRSRKSAPALDRFASYDYPQKEAAALLGLSYDQFRQRYRKYGLGKD